jgi:hypothetical protein
MTADNERDKILQMIEAGRISADEAARLLDAIGSDRDFDRPAERLRSRLVRVRVSDSNQHRTRVSVTIPVSLINVGLRLGARLAPQLNDSALAELLHTIESGKTGRLLEWQDLEENERIEIFVE